MVKQDNSLPIERKCKLLSLNRSGLYRKKKPVRDANENLVNEIKSIYEKYPFFGYRRVHAMLKQRAYQVNHKKVQRLMQENGLRAIYPKRRTSLANKEHKKYPYLLKKPEIICPNQAWQVDLTYLKIRGGFVYLVCLIDIFSRKIMGWNLSPFLDTASCIAALNNALERAIPEIINSDQGSQFTSESWCSLLIDHGIKISMDGKGRWADNIYIERLWRSIKYELVYLHRFTSVPEIRSALEQYIEFYNGIRPHQSLRYLTPEEVYRGTSHVNNAIKSFWSGFFPF